MYLYVYVMLLVGIIGYYTQVFLLRTAQIEANQTTVAEAMVLWHDAAYREAKENITTILGGGVNSCALGKDSAHPDVTANCSSTLTVPAFLSANMHFNSIAYRVGTQDYLVTYVSNDGAGFAKLGYSQDAVYQQMVNAGISRASMGKTVTGTCNGDTGSWVKTTSSVGGEVVCYPTNNGGTIYIPNNVVGLVSPL